MATDGAAEEVKSRLDIVEHISDYVQLKRSGQNYKGNCPFHTEKTPSFMVHPAKQIFHCFGCSAGGDIFTFTMKHEGLSFPEALALLARKAGVELKPQSGYKKGERERLKAAVVEAMKFFRAELKRSSVAGQYIEQRGLTPEIIEEFQVGYVPQGWHNLLNHLKKKSISEDIIIKAGLAVRGDRGPYDVFRARLIFPILDLHGEPVAFGGRVLDDSQPKYLNSPESSLFKKGDTLYALSQAREAIRKEGFVAVSEGYLDAIMCHQFGMKNVVAPLGTALTAGHLKKLMRHADDIVLVFDGDAAGVAAARRSLDLIMEQNMRVKVLMLPDGEDPDSLLRDEGAEGMRARMMNALSPVGFILETTKKPKGIDAAVEMIAKAGDPILRDELAVELADRSRISEQAIRDKLSRYKKTGQHSAPR
ncbi:MAG: DNA primase, partial [Thermodesulfovibrionales bacterium]|nr:DNA primase [Thermodesulfovibrionales bacterium]